MAVRDVINELKSRKVITKIRELFSHSERTIIISDTETNPANIISQGYNVRRISTEAGVLTCGLGQGSDEGLQGELGIDPDKAIIQTLMRAKTQGFRKVVLVINPNSTAGVLDDTSIKQLIDHAVRASFEIDGRVSGLTVMVILHVPDGGSFVNYRVNSYKWQEFYDAYEQNELGRDSEGAVVGAA